MRKLIVMFALIAIVALVITGAALAQDSALVGLVQPVAVTIQQAVPVTVVLALPQADGSTITTRVPLTVGISLQVTLDGANVVAVAPTEEQPAVVAAADAPADGAGLVDLSGIPYTVDSAHGIIVTQARFRDLIGDNVELIGELRNDGDEPSRYTMLHVKFYDANGGLLVIGTGYATTESLEPGATSGFRVMTETDFDQVASYAIEIR